MIISRRHLGTIVHVDEEAPEFGVLFQQIQSFGNDTKKY
jgi:hypothetical protein